MSTYMTCYTTETGIPGCRNRYVYVPKSIFYLEFSEYGWWFQQSNIGWNGGKTNWCFVPKVREKHENRHRRCSKKDGRKPHIKRQFAADNGEKENIICAILLMHITTFISRKNLCLTSEVEFQFKVFNQFPLQILMTFTKLLSCNIILIKNVN